MTLNYELYVTGETKEAAELVAELAKLAIPAGIDLRAGRHGTFCVVLVEDARYTDAYTVRETVFRTWRNAEADRETAASLARIENKGLPQDIELAIRDEQSFLPLSYALHEAFIGHRVEGRMGRTQAYYAFLVSPEDLERAVAVRDSIR